MHTPKHRHLVAAPVAILGILMLAGLSTFVPVRAEITGGSSVIRISASSSDQTFNVGRGVAGILRSGSALTADDAGAELHLRNGQALFRATESVNLDLGQGISVTALRSSFVAVHDQDAVTIAALDTPLLYVTGTSATLLPEGQQVRLQPGRPEQRTAIGSEWYALQMTDLASLGKVPDTAFRNASFASALMHPEAGTCMAALSREHLTRADLRTALSFLLSSGRITSDTYGCIRQLSVGLDDTKMLSRLVLLILTTEGSRTDDAASDAMLDDFRNDPVLFAMYPTVLPDLALSEGRPAQAAFLRYFPKFVIETGLTDPPAALAILQHAVSVPRALSLGGLPLQSDAWKSALARAIVVLKTTVPVSERPALDQLLTQVLAVPPPPRDEEKVESAAPSLPPPPVTHWSTDELLAITRDILATHGALFATTTVLTPDTGSQTVSVDGIFVFEDGKNVPYSFTYDPSKEVLTRIVRDGHRLPNAVPLATFFKE